jgi:hypothetical protein
MHRLLAAVNRQTRGKDEVGSAAREWPQVKSGNGNCNNNTMDHNLSVNVSNITNCLHPKI